MEGPVQERSGGNCCGKLPANPSVSGGNYCIYVVVFYIVCNIIYNMSGRIVSDIQTRAEGEWLYILYNTDANVVYSL